MNNQDILEKVIKGLKQQNYRRSGGTNGGSCEYLSENGDKCAIGHLLSEEVLQKITKAELNTVPLSKLVSYEILEDIENDANSMFLTALQEWHDGDLIQEGGLTEGAKKQLEYIAKEYGVDLIEL